jgi:tRNA(Ile)-lysidine synthase
MNSFFEQVRHTIHKYGMLDKGDTVVVAVSGGADSLCLLHVLNSLKAELDLKLFAVHLNHQFRGIEAEQDADFVEHICGLWELPCRIESFDVGGYAREKGLSSEEAGREIRYKLFYETKAAIQGDKIAVAQNSNDNVETVLMRLLRGAGLEGLKGIDAVREDIIRPLLETQRRDIEEYCRQNELVPRVDQTNLQPVYLRNKIRLELLPYLSRHFNPNINDTLQRLSQVVREENDYLEQQAEALFTQIAKLQEQSISMTTSSLKKLHPAMQKRVLRQAVATLAGTLTGFEHKHFTGILGLLDRNTGAAIELPRKLRAYISYENLIVGKKIVYPDKKCYYKLKYNSEYFIEDLKAAVNIQVMDREALADLSKAPGRVYLDAGKVRGQLVLRNRRQGDMISPIGMKGSKKLKDYFIDKKVPKEEREEILLLADENEVVWIVGGIISEKYKITADTTKIIAITVFSHNKLQ